jgi:hypothetical protein
MLIFARDFAGVAQLVEHDLAKVGVAGSSPVSRSKKRRLQLQPFFLCAIPYTYYILNRWIAFTKARPETWMTGLKGITWVMKLPQPLVYHGS